MGIEDYLLAGAVIGIQGQRLVRKICDTCKEVEDVPLDNLASISKYIPKDAVFYHGKGCAVCNNKGYTGREMISEVLLISEELSTMIANGATKDQMREQAFKEGFTTMLEDGINKALAGKTSVEEILRVAR